MNSWTSPAKLGTTLPRRAKMSMAIMLGMIVLQIVCIPIMSFSVAIIFVHSEKIALLQERGVAVSGDVIDKRITSDNHEKVYHIDYHYEINGESSGYQSETNVVPDTSYGSVKVGYPVPVVYDPMRPDRAMLNINNSLYPEICVLYFKHSCLRFLLYYLFLECHQY
jgi:hypothetical protein